jgi:hypothetical protein|tara:strand:- start:84 stop:353 length:270 start_codon:yes stop_codon:yes gene_type:complete
LTFEPVYPIVRGSNNRAMTLTSKFKKDLQTIKAASNGDFFLDVKNPKLYKKLRRYYEKEGLVEFTGDALNDYDVLIECVKEDLKESEVV